MSKNFLVNKVTTWLKYKYYIVVLKVKKNIKSVEHKVKFK